MKKYTNPFYTILEATEVLKSLGADPISGATSWQENILGINISKSHTLHESYNEISIHMNRVGFDKLVQLLKGEFPVTRELCFEDYDMYTIEPSEGLKIFKLVYREEME